MPRRRWAIGWPAWTASPSFTRYSSTRPAAALPTRLRRIGFTVPTNARGSAIVSARAGVTITLGAGGAGGALAVWAGNFGEAVSQMMPITATAVAPTIRLRRMVIICINRTLNRISRILALPRLALRGGGVQIGLNHSEQLD